MVIISTGVCDKYGRPLVTRQYESMTKTMVEDMYTSFPKLITKGQQHTYVQSDKYLFLYVPIETLFLVLISTRNSNIVEDQDTLRLLYKVLSAICAEGINEGMDDVVSMGYRESVTLQEVMVQLKMESAEERAHNALLKQQEQEAKAAAEKAAKK